MRLCVVFLACFVVGMSSGQQNAPNSGLSANANARPGAASGEASSSQNQSGRRIAVGGSTSVNSNSASSGNAGARALATGYGGQKAGTTGPVRPDQNAGNGSQQASGAGDGSGNAAPVDNSTVLVGGGPVETGVVYPNITEGGVAPPQVPGVWDALDDLRGKAALQADEIQAILATAVAGTDYPNLAEIPNQTGFNCAKVKQAGFYADTDFRCQVFRRCDINGIETSYLCPNQTVFNQIVLVCDWFYNVNCANAAKYYDYSNSRLYHPTWVLLDTPAEKVVAPAAVAGR